ncbi:MAG: WbqC family protein [Promethearchaeota archaeon]
MILTAHQPAYLPWLGFFHKMAISDKFIILDAVQYQKNYFTNRNLIKTAHGETWLTVPVLTSGHLDKTIAEMKINNNTNWRKKHWKTIELNYRRAPFFEKYRDYFESLYQKKWINLIDLLYENIKFFVKELEIDIKIYLQSEFTFKKTKQELILEMCNYFDSDLFVFGKDGKRYADLDYFKENNRKIYFQDYKHPTYPQLYEKFISKLSIIDLLFNVGSKKAMGFIMKENATKKDLIKRFTQ